MKITKKLLLVAASTFLLAGCNESNTDGICPQCPECAQYQSLAGVDTITDEETTHKKAAQDRIIEIFEDAKQSATNQEVKTLLDDFKSMALRELEAFSNFGDEDEAIECAEHIVENYVTLIKYESIARIGKRVANLLEEIDDHILHSRISEIYADGLRDFDDECDSFEAIITTADRIMSEIDEATGSSEENDWRLKYVETLRSNCWNTISLCAGYIDGSEYAIDIEELVLQLNDALDEEEADALVKTLSDRFYGEILIAVKDRLCNELYAYVERASDEITFESVKEEAFIGTDDNSRAIEAATSIDEAVECYTKAIENAEYIVVSRIRRWGIDQITDVYDENKSAFPQFTHERGNLDNEFYRVRTILENEHFNTFNVEPRVRDYVEGFNEFVEGLSQEI